MSNHIRLAPCTALLGAALLAPGSASAATKKPAVVAIRRVQGTKKIVKPARGAAVAQRVTTNKIDRDALKAYLKHPNPVRYVPYEHRNGLADDQMYLSPHLHVSSWVNGWQVRYDDGNVRRDATVDDLLAAGMTAKNLQHFVQKQYTAYVKKTQAEQDAAWRRDRELLGLPTDPHAHAKNVAAIDQGVAAARAWASLFPFFYR